MSGKIPSWLTENSAPHGSRRCAICNKEMGSEECCSEGGGWTDDLTIPLPHGKTPADVVEYVLQGSIQKTPYEKLVAQLIAEFSLSPEDAELAWDRSHGGIVRAATLNAANCPDQQKDPIAWESYQRGIQDHSLIARLYPEYASARTCSEQQSAQTTPAVPSISGFFQRRSLARHVIRWLFGSGHQR